MRTTLLHASSELSPPSAALVNSLMAAGHDVTVGRWVKRGLPRRSSLEEWAWPPTATEPLTDAAKPDVIFAATSHIVGTADRAAGATGAFVSRLPRWPAPERDLIGAVPPHPELSVPARHQPPELDPWMLHVGAPQIGRHQGRTVILAYRPTSASPARLLQAGLERAGVTVIAVDEVDYGQLPRADAVVFVESPTPPISVTGVNPGMPVLFWVHHGEHHLDGNLRLADRYGVDLVLLAHSWHLALRFNRRVERFPFAAPRVEALPFSSRQFDLAFVGAITGSAYQRRRRLIDQARTQLPAVKIEDKVPPDRVTTLYSNSKAVLNDGGSRHLPITMRVFEAIGAGAFLVSDPAPGLELLFPNSFMTMAPEGLDAERLSAALQDGTAEAAAFEAHQRLRTTHTYDHRADLLLRLIDSVDSSHLPMEPPLTPLDRFLFDHPYGQRLLDATGRVHNPDREIWAPDSATIAPGAFDTVIMDQNSSPHLAKTARRYVVGWRLDVDRLDITPRSVTTIDDLFVIDVGGDGYDIATVGQPTVSPRLRGDRPT